MIVEKTVRTQILLPDGTVGEGVPVGEPAGEAAVHSKNTTLIRKEEKGTRNGQFELLPSINLLTIAEADRWSLNIAGAWKGHGLGLIDADPKGGAAAIEDLAETLRLGTDDAGELRAAVRGRSGGVPGDVVEAWGQTDESAGTARGRLCRCTSPEGHCYDQH